MHSVTLGHFRSRYKDCGHHSIRCSQKSQATRKLYVSMFYRTGVIVDGSFTLQKWGFLTFFAPVTLTLTQKNFIYELDPHSLEIYRM